MTGMISAQDFLGITDRDLAYSFDKWLVQARSVHDTLARDGKDHILTEYLSRLLELTGKLPIPEATMAGFTAAQELMEICTSIVCGTGKKKERPFYATAARYVAGHPLPLANTATQAALYYTRLSAKYIKSACKVYCEEVLALSQEIYADDILQEHFERICMVLDDSAPMTFMNGFFRQRFLLGPVSTLFYQGEANFLASVLVMDDTDTKKEVFRYMLDGVLPPFEG